MKRRKFLSNVLCYSAAAVAAPAVFSSLSKRKIVSLPSFSGILEVELEATHGATAGAAFAQQYQYYTNAYGYHRALQHQQYYAQQQALAQWQAFLQHQAMQQYIWMQQQHIAAMQSMMMQRPNYQISSPNVWNAVRSIYGYGRRATQDVFGRLGTQDVMVGLNRNLQQVETSDTLPAFGALFEKLKSENVPRNDIEQAAGPQTNEQPVKISLPDGSLMDGKFFRSEAGAIAQSDQTVHASNGKVGKLAKYVLDGQGEKYLVI